MRRLSMGGKAEMIRWTFRIQQQAACALAVTTGGLMAAAYLSSPVFGMWAALAMGATTAVSMAGVGNGKAWGPSHVPENRVSVRYVPPGEPKSPEACTCASCYASRADAEWRSRNGKRV